MGPDISKGQLMAAAVAQAPALFNSRNSDPSFNEAKENALQIIANGFIAAGLTVEGHEVKTFES